MLLLVFKTDTEKPAVNNVWLQLFKVYLLSIYSAVVGLRGRMCTLSSCGEWALSYVRLFATPWTVAHICHGILQARILEWVAIPFSRGSF